MSYFGFDVETIFVREWNGRFILLFNVELKTVRNEFSSLNSQDYLTVATWQSFCGRIIF